MPRQGRLFSSAAAVAAAVALAACTGTHQPTWSWESLGYASVASSGEYWETYSGTSIAVGPLDGLPVIAFCESGVIRVKRYSGGATWVDLGSLGGGTYPWVTIDRSDNRPIVAFSGSGSVAKWSGGTDWTSLGSAGEGPLTLFTTIALDPTDGKPVVAFAEDQGSGSKARVKKWSNGTTWIDLGYASTGAASYVSLAVGSDGAPVVAYSDVSGGYSTRVVKWSGGTSWIDLGFPSWLEGTDTALVINPSDNMPLVMNRGGYVYKLSASTTWTSMGTPVPYGRLMSPSMLIRPVDLSPVVAFIDELNGYQVCVYGWFRGVEWEDMGHPNAGAAGHPSVAIDPPSGLPIVVFTDGTAGWRAHAMKARFE